MVANAGNAAGKRNRDGGGGGEGLFRFTPTQQPPPISFNRLLSAFFYTSLHFKSFLWIIPFVDTLHNFIVFCLSSLTWSKC